MNKMKEVAQLLGVELGEKFNIIDEPDNPYYIDEEGIYDKDDILDIQRLLLLLRGDLKIEKLPFKPEYRQEYWTVMINDCVIESDTSTWIGYSIDYCRYKLGLVFRTEKETKEIGIPRLKEIIKEYEDD